MGTVTVNRMRTWQCPHCPRKITGYNWTIWNHEQSHNPDGHPLSKREWDPCTDCGQTPNVSSNARKPPPGSIRYGSNGRCSRCARLRRRHQIQPPGTPKAERYPRELLLSEIRELRLQGVHHYVEQAERLGMKPLSLKRALDRARAARKVPEAVRS